MNFIPNLKYKTQYCLPWLNGQICERGYNCFFAHGQCELRTIQQNQAEIAFKNMTLKFWHQTPQNYKTVYCKFYSRGIKYSQYRSMQTWYSFKQLGDTCTFAHSKKQKRRFTELQNQQPYNYDQEHINQEINCMNQGMQGMTNYEEYQENNSNQKVNVQYDNHNDIDSPLMQKKGTPKSEQRTLSQESDQEKEANLIEKMNKLNLTEQIKKSAVEALTVSQ